MRVIAGTLGGRVFESPHTARTHPMSDKVRGALFNALGDLSGLTVFDPFAGSGAISIEAISRGALSAVALDLDKSAIATIIANIKTLHLQDTIEARLANAGSWSRRNQQRNFDVVIADPPYNDIDRILLAKVADRCKVGGLVVLSLPPTGTVKMLPDHFELVSSKAHGDATLSFYRRSASNLAPLAVE